MVGLGAARLSYSHCLPAELETHRRPLLLLLLRWAPIRTALLSEPALNRSNPPPRQGGGGGRVSQCGGESLQRPLFHGRTARRSAGVRRRRAQLRCAPHTLGSACCSHLAKNSTKKREKRTTERGGTPTRRCDWTERCRNALVIGRDCVAPAGGAPLLSRTDPLRLLKSY